MKFYNKLKFSSRIFTLIFTFTFVTAVIIAGIACYVSYNHVTILATQTSEQIVLRAASEIDHIFENMISAAKIASNSYELQNYIREETRYGNSNSSDHISGDNYLSNLNAQNNDIFAMYFFANNGFGAKSKYYQMDIPSIIDSDIYKNATSTNQNMWLISNSGSFFAKTTPYEELIALVYPVTNIANGQVGGVIVVEIRKSLIADCINGGISREGFLFITDENYNVVIEPSDITPSQTMYLHEQEFLNDEHLVITEESVYTGYEFIGFIPSTEVNDSMQDIIFGVIIAVTASLIIAGFLATKISKKEVKPINTLCDTMAEVEKGNLSVISSIDRSDEIGLLSIRFNNMIQTINNLMDKLRSNHETIRMSELKLLQAQINPHFLYNTLDSITWLARNNKNDLVVKMVIALTRFFKIGLSRGKEIISIKEELEHIKNYLIIQNIRYSEKFNYKIIVDESLYNHQVPKLLLQPLVENAIYHAIKPLHRLCVITINVYSDEETIYLSVSDDGVGMSEDALTALRNTIHNKSGNVVSSYGLLNIRDRIRIMFGEKYGLTVYSEEGKGSEFIVNIPKNGGDMHDQNNYSG